MIDYYGVRPEGCICEVSSDIHYYVQCPAININLGHPCPRNKKT